MLVDAEAMVTRAHGEALEKFLDTNGFTRDDIAIIGFHGQTVLHRPAQQLTIQIGNGPALAKRVGIPVAYDFRAADVAAGGQGAPARAGLSLRARRDASRQRPYGGGQHRWRRKHLILRSWPAAGRLRYRTRAMP